MANHLDREKSCWLIFMSCEIYLAVDCDIRITLRSSMYKHDTTMM